MSAISRVRGGVAVAHNKNTADMKAERIPEPSTVVLPMQQHIGSRCTPTVKVGDIVKVGQLIGDSDKPLTAPIHASVSGKVRAINNVKLANGHMTFAVTIESDGRLEDYEGIEPPSVKSREDLIAAVRASGLVGLGGAGFPAHIKLNYPKDRFVDTLVINAAECEPYITVDYRECIENTQDIMEGIQLLVDMLEFRKVVFAIEDNKPLAIEAFKKAIDADKSKYGAFNVMSLKSKYPQGAEKVIVESATGRRIPPGKLPLDVQTVVMNVASCGFISRYLKTGKPLVSRTMTVDGTAIMNPKNVRVPIGISVQEVIDFCGGFKGEPYKLIAGGPMMGTALVETSVPVLKKDNAILAFSKEGMKIKKETQCIRCGRCAAVCPMSLAPTLIEQCTVSKDVKGLQSLGINVCMECGSCSYACPAGKPLVQYMRLGKEIVREAQTGNG